MDEKIECLNDKLRGLGGKFSEKVSSLKGDYSHKGGVQKELRAYYDELKIHTLERQAIYDKVTAVNDEIKELDSRRTKAKRKIDPKCTKVE